MSRVASFVGLSVITFTLTLGAAQIAAGATFYIDGAKADAAACGTAAATACKTYRYWYQSGCDSNGCGNNVAPGDTISFKAGTYRGDGGGGYFGIPFDGTAAAPITVACADAPGSCIISGSGVTATNWCGLVGIGLTPGQGYCAAEAASYVRLRGFKIQQVPSGMYAIQVSSASHHATLQDTTVDGAGANRSLLLVQSGVSYLTLKDNTFTNCPAGDTGCTYFDGTTNLAEIGNTFGPVASSGNYDCNTLLGVQRGLLDGNVCTSTADGFDEGMQNTTQLDNVIVRYNRVSGATSRAFPLSGDRKDSGTLTGSNILYGNVAHPDASGRTGRCFEFYEGVEGLDLWYNTCFASNDAGWGDALWLNARGDYSSYLVRNIKLGYNLFDTKSTNNSALIVLDQDAATSAGCPSGAPCPFTKNRLWMPERGGAASCVYWDPSDQPQSGFSCDQFGTTFNVTGNQGNLRADPALANRSQPQVLASLKLSPTAAGYVDAGRGFCRASAAGSGNTVAVACDGTSGDPRHYFPDPTRFFDVQNADCQGRGVRTASGVDGGCYAVQIEGACGARQITAMTATSITFNGASCSWTAGAMVHVPWNGLGPDIGALEATAAASPPPPPTLISVQPVP